MSELHRWTQSDGEWACAAYDHGPFCRLCRHITDALERQLLDAVDEGHMTVRTTATGAFEFKITEAGTARAQQLIESDPEYFDLYMHAVIESAQ